MEPLQVLFEDPLLPSFSLPETLATLYGGSFGFEEDRVVANFVASIDGVTAIPGSERSSQLISGGSEADRLVMGMLRASVDVVVVGAGTLRNHPGARWTAEQAAPSHGAAFAELRRRLGRRGSEPDLAVVTASGKLDPAHPALARAKILTTEKGAASLGERLHGGSIVVLGEDDGAIEPSAAIEVLRRVGDRSILVEGGPRLLGSFVAHGAVDELFLTVSPLLAGRSETDYRPGLVDGIELLPDDPQRTRLLSVRGHDSYLFLRYGLVDRGSR